MQFVERQAVALGISAVRLYAHEAMTEASGFYTTLDDGETERRVEDGYAGVHLQKSIGGAKPLKPLCDTMLGCVLFEMISRP